MKRNNFSIMAKLIGMVKPLLFFMILAIVMGVVGFLSSTFITILGGYAVLNILNIFTGLSLKAIFIIIGTIAILRGFLRYAEQTSNHYIAFKILALLRDKVFRSLRRLSPAKIEGKDKGDLISVITSDIELLEVFYAHTISPIAIAFFMTAIMTIFIGQYHVVLGAIALIAYITVGVVVPLIASKKSGNISREFRKESGELSSFILDSLRGLGETIQYHGGEERLKKIDENTDKLSQKEEKLKNVTGKNTATTNQLILIFSLCVLFVSAILYKNQLIGFDGVLIPTIAMMSSFGPVVAIANLGSTLQQTFAAGNRVLDILEESPIVEDITGKGEVEFKGAEVCNVDFAYDSTPILEGYSLEIPKNQVIGIKGKSGCGKSTLLKLLMRFWKANSGDINISDVNIHEINTTNLRDMESYVTQDTHLFNESFFENVRIAKTDATKEEVVAACKKASIHDFIQALPNGYDTNVGELGDMISGGERQRIGLARAFLHNAPFMLLDEPTSNLDSLNETIILKSLFKEKEDKTVVIVSHRDSTMRIADVVHDAKMSASRGEI